MVQAKKRHRSETRTHLFEWVGSKLRPISGLLPEGTYKAWETVADKDCPVCGRPMREHTIDHSTRNTILNCPVPHPGAWDRDAFEPVNEFGMVKRANRTEQP